VGTTLSLTNAGRALDVVSDKIGYKAARRLVEEASESFARGASGEVHVFLKLETLRQTSIWSTVERGILLRNPNVTKIVFHTVGDLLLGP
jgi:hypothetical protein